MHIRLLALFMCLGSGLAGQSVSRMLKEADGYFEREKYRPALQYYMQAGNAQTWKKGTRLRVAICQYEINELNGAISLLTDLVRDKKTDPEVYYYLARCYHHKLRFRSAIAMYKEYLKHNTKKSSRRDWIEDELLRCANGVSLQYGHEIAYVENMGVSVNSSLDEYGPMPSPNHTDRIYFTGAREDSEGGSRNSQGVLDPKYGNYSSDIYYSINSGGVWGPVVPLDNILNSSLNEQLYCFSIDGQRMYFRRGASTSIGELVVDTFATSSSYKGSPVNIGPFRPMSGDRDLCLFNDTIMLFGSQRGGGYGGYDLYYSIRRNGSWGEAVNLGKGVNSFYDEVSPFLVRNGRILYFSSDRLESIGGMDVFTTTFVDSLEQWIAPENLGLPVNSAGDDMYFRLAPDGLKGFLSSDRKDGFGARDIYVAYFKEQVRGHLSLSNPLTFMHFEHERERRNLDAAVIEKSNVREYVISDLWFESDDIILNSQNIRKLDILTNLLLIYPKLTLDLICHVVPSGPRSYDLFFSVKKAEQVAEYLIQKGVMPSRIGIKGAGTYYPIAGSDHNGASGAGIDRLNRRVEIQVYGANPSQVLLTFEVPHVPPNIRDDRGFEFSALQKVMTYHVQVASTTHLLQHDIFDEYQDVMIDFNYQSKVYHYLVGTERNYESIKPLRGELVEKGFPLSEIRPYLDGRPLTRSEAQQYTDQYPDLLNYLSD